jgi:hypothetical protein
MIGNNEITLNEATVISAIQFYFNTVLFAPAKAPNVTGVSLNNNSFHVKVTEATKALQTAKVPA